jgi:hypothetical protein
MLSYPRPCMADEPSDKRVKCATHGTTVPTFVCCHLAPTGSSRLRACYNRESEEPWPDLVCHACSDEPEWTDEQALARIRLLCAY